MGEKNKKAKQRVPKECEHDWNEYCPGYHRVCTLCECGQWFKYRKPPPDMKGGEWIDE